MIPSQMHCTSSAKARTLRSWKCASIDLFMFEAQIMANRNRCSDSSMLSR